MSTPIGTIHAIPGPTGPTGPTGPSGPAGPTGVSGGGGSATLTDVNASTVTATNPTVEVVHSISVPAGGAIHFVWTSAVLLSDAGSQAIATVNTDVLTAYGLGTVQGHSGDPLGTLTNPTIVADGTSIGTGPGYTNFVIMGVALNPDVAAQNADFTLGEFNAVGTAQCSGSTLVYWLA